MVIIYNQSFVKESIYHSFTTPSVVFLYHFLVTPSFFEIFPTTIKDQPPPPASSKNINPLSKTNLLNHTSFSFNLKTKKIADSRNFNTHLC